MGSGYERLVAEQFCLQGETAGEEGLASKLKLPKRRMEVTEKEGGIVDN